MMSDPWLTIIGLGEDGPEALPGASRKALAAAEIIFGGPRHLALVDAGTRGHAWPVPFSVDPVLSNRGKSVVVLASGDPFWYGAGGSLMPHLKADEWLSLPAPSTFSRLANLLGWKLEEVTCLGLHAQPLARLRSQLTQNARMLVLLRDGPAVGELARYLTHMGFGASDLHIAEALGGASQRLRHTTANAFDLTDVAAPVAVAIAACGPKGLPRIPGLPDDTFLHDGQITKAPVRAMTIAALAPRAGEVLWDIGAGSGSVSVEWCLAGGHAVAFERKPARCENIAGNIAAFGLTGRMQLLSGPVGPASFADLALPDAVFVGGGAKPDLLAHLYTLLPTGTRLVINAVTLETESLLLQESAAKGGSLMRLDLAQATPLGTMRGWTPARSLVQWSVTL
jgi:precorrin-6Y C5,15-methyltransferase (decarboxylating)